MKKWKGVRDSYNRSVKPKTKSGQGSEPSRKYQYARQLEFLQYTGKKAPTKTSLDVDMDLIDQNEDDIDDPSVDDHRAKTNDEPEYTEISDGSQTNVRVPSGEITVTPSKRKPQSQKKSFDELPAAKRKKEIEKNLLQFMQTPIPPAAPPAEPK